LTPEQRADLLLWNGRVNLMDRVKFVRRYALYTGAMCIAGFFGVAFGVSAEVPPMVLSPLVPLYMAVKLRRRGKSLRASGLRLRRVFLRLRARSAIPAPEATAIDRRLDKLASKAILAGRFGSVIRRAAADRAAINELIAGMPKADRELLPDITPTVDALFERVVGLAEAVQRMETDINPALIAELNARIDALPDEENSPDEQRRIALLRRQRDSLAELSQRRTTMVRQLESAGLALGNLRYDLMKLRSSGLESALGDVSSATQEARALSKEIGMALAVAAEVREL
jgi:serine/threonine-protein kinase